MLMRWEPFGSIRRRGDFFSELTSMQQEMNRLFDEFFGESRAEIAEGTWLPAVDVSETEAEMVVRVELPGLSKENIELSLHDNVLTLKGEKKQEKKEEKENYHRVERSYGSFNRSLTLPADVDQSKIQATFKNGVLEIVLPKAEEAKQKKIEVSTK
jgi:HSP20 family protein